MQDAFSHQGGPLWAEKVKETLLSESLQTFNLVLRSMSGSDACPVWLDQVVVAALPVSASRHNSPAHPHFLNKLVCSHLPGGDACIVVSVYLKSFKKFITFFIGSDA